MTKDTLTPFQQKAVDTVERFFKGCEAAKQPQLNADAVVDKDFGALLSSARKQVKASPLYRKFIDGTPLENDIAVWMAEFAVKGGES